MPSTSFGNNGGDNDEKPKSPTNLPPLQVKFADSGKKPRRHQINQTIDVSAHSIESPT